MLLQYGRINLQSFKPTYTTIYIRSTQARFTNLYTSAKIFWKRLTGCAQVENGALWQIIHMFSVKTMEHFTMCH